MARQLIEESLAGAPPEQIVGALAVLSTLVTKRVDDEADFKLQLKAYTERLRPYPADIVMHTLNDWPNHQRFWPAWAELFEQLEAKIQWRREMQIAVGRATERSIEAPREKEISPEERAELAAKLQGLARSLGSSRAGPSAAENQVVSLADRVAARAAERKNGRR